MMEVRVDDSDPFEAKLHPEVSGQQDRLVEREPAGAISASTHLG